MAIEDKIEDFESDVRAVVDNIRAVKGDKIATTSLLMAKGVASVKMAEMMCADLHPVKKMLVLEGFKRAFTEALDAYCAASDITEDMLKESTSLSVTLIDLIIKHSQRMKTS